MLNKQLYEKVFSVERMRRYLEKYPNNTPLALRHYLINIELSEALHPILSMYELCLRNNVSKQLVRHFENSDWHLEILSITTRHPNSPLSNLRKPLLKAIATVEDRGHLATIDQVIPELTLGFWTALFNQQYEMELFQKLRLSFPNMPRNIRRRTVISPAINRVRRFRNRVFHHEPIAWRSRDVQRSYKEIMTYAKYMNRHLPKVIRQVDRFPRVLKKAKQQLPNNW